MYGNDSIKEKILWPEVDEKFYLKIMLNLLFNLMAKQEKL